MKTIHSQHYIWPFGPMVDRYQIYLDGKDDKTRMSDYVSFGPTDEDIEVLKRCGLQEAER